MADNRTCKDCRWLSGCQRSYGADPRDPICTGFVWERAKPARLSPPLNERME